MLCVHLFHWYGLFEHFQLDVCRVWKLFSESFVQFARALQFAHVRVFVLIALIEEGYHGTNPYHNAIHATDVTQAMHCFLQEEKVIFNAFLNLV